MASSSSDNLITMMDPWIRSSTFSDAWLSEAFTRDDEALTKAFQKSLYDNQSGSDFDYTLYPEEIQNPIGDQMGGTHFSGGLENETVAFKGKDADTATVGINGGKITKRKRRKSKRSSTIFITADPVNFRRMVQEVTGAKLEDNNLQLPFFMPEPEHRPSCLPTFDTSAFLLGSTNNQQYLGPDSTSLGRPPVSGGVSNGLPETMTDGGGGSFDFGSVCRFPTLDSWNVM